MASGTFSHGAASITSHDTTISVATSQDTTIIHSIENGECVEEGAIDDETRSLTKSIRQHIIHIFLALIHNILQSGAHVLDLGTGTGRWCIELANVYPNSIFEGMDLTAIQPDWHESGWTYLEDKLDYVHVRHLIHSIKDRGQMWKRIYSHFKPGSYVEIQEFMYTAACDDNSCDGPYAVRDFLNYLAAGLQALGSDLNSIQYIKEELIDSGFTELCYQDLKCPIGPWAKNLRLQECGHILRDVTMWGLEGLARRPFRDGLHWTPTQIHMFLVNVRTDLAREDGKVPPFHSYFPFRSIYDRKPLDSL
ncbi:hypothetical protein E4U30_004001 [Claviceps sp. LM220 group G6]|nr:hypothetical protein E4U30_004001 [Claviceps sp. LM220 group G6]